MAPIGAAGTCVRATSRAGRARTSSTLGCSRASGGARRRATACAPARSKPERAQAEGKVWVKTGSIPCVLRVAGCRMEARILHARRLCVPRPCRPCSGLSAGALRARAPAGHLPAAPAVAGLRKPRLARQARVALRFPWWTLAGGFDGMAALAELGSGAAEVQAALARQATTSQARAAPISLQEGSSLGAHARGTWPPAGAPGCFCSGLLAATINIPTFLPFSALPQRTVRCAGRPAAGHWRPAGRAAARAGGRGRAAGPCGRRRGLLGRRAAAACGPVSGRGAPGPGRVCGRVARACRRRLGLLRACEDCRVWGAACAGQGEHSTPQTFARDQTCSM